ncbi:MAG: hypothetical protein IPG96_20000 [Proteobacteria bacterium]|nr:hypothetical protein [Pseudomonadota bacterium]
MGDVFLGSEGILASRHRRGGAASPLAAVLTTWITGVMLCVQPSRAKDGASATATPERSATTTARSAGRAGRTWQVTHPWTRRLFPGREPAEAYAFKARRVPGRGLDGADHATLVLMRIEEGRVDPAQPSQPPGGTYPRRYTTTRYDDLAPEQIETLRAEFAADPSHLLTRLPMGLQAGGRDGTTAEGLRVFLPGARQVVLEVDGCEPLPMSPDPREPLTGAWVAALSALRPVARGPEHTLAGRSYVLHVTDFAGVTRTVADPDAPALRATAADGARSLPPADSGAQWLPTDLQPGGLPYQSVWADLPSFPWSREAMGFETSTGAQAPPAGNTVIYETQLPALTRHASAAAGDKAGTLAGFVESVVAQRHLDRLGVDQIETLPLHAQERHRWPDGHLTGAGDWGYFNPSYRQVAEALAHDRSQPQRELMRFVDALHSRGRRLLLDVVFNHGGYLLALAWGKYPVWRIAGTDDAGHTRYHEGSGCGPELATELPMVREAIVQSLLHFVRAYHVDGFRFDLAGLLDKELLFELDRRLPRHVGLIAEPWGFGRELWNRYAHAHELASTRWQLWNDFYRDAALRFIGAQGLANPDPWETLRQLKVGLGGSLYGRGPVSGWMLDPRQSINYLSAHDGRTLADQMPPEEGAKGRKRRAALGLIMTLLAHGTPMIAEGSVCMRSRGERDSWNNPALNVLDYTLTETHADLVDLLGGVVKLRVSLPHWNYSAFPAPGRPGGLLSFRDLPDQPRALGLLLPDPRGTEAAPLGPWPLFAGLNGHSEAVTLTLPELPDGQAWVPIVDSSRLDSGQSAFDRDGLTDDRGHRRSCRSTVAVPALSACVLAPATSTGPAGATVRPPQ